MKAIILFVRYILKGIIYFLHFTLGMSYMFVSKLSSYNFKC